MVVEFEIEITFVGIILLVHRMPFQLIQAKFPRTLVKLLTPYIMPRLMQVVCEWVLGFEGCCRSVQRHIRMELLEVERSRQPKRSSWRFPRMRFGGEKRENAKTSLKLLGLVKVSFLLIEFVLPAQPDVPR